MTSSGLGWSQPLTITDIVESLQRMIHYLHVLAEKDRRQFTGIVLTDILYVSPEEERTFWRVTIEPQGLVEVVEERTDEDVRTAS